MQKNKKNKKTAREKFGEMLDMPVDIVKDYYRMTVIGNESILLENHRGIMEYEENVIRFNNNVNVFGSDLKIEEITDDDILITGSIKNIEFED